MCQNTGIGWNVTANGKSICFSHHFSQKWFESLVLLILSTPNKYTHYQPQNRSLLTVYHTFSSMKCNSLVETFNQLSLIESDKKKFLIKQTMFPF